MRRQRQQYKMRDIERGYAGVEREDGRFAGFAVSNNGTAPWFAGDRAGSQLAKCRTRKLAVYAVIKHDRKLLRST